MMTAMNPFRHLNAAFIDACRQTKTSLDNGRSRPAVSEVEMAR
jgi:hypothetical protein